MKTPSDLWYTSALNQTTSCAAGDMTAQRPAEFSLETSMSLIPTDHYEKNQKIRSL